MRKLTAGLAITLDGVVDAPSGNWMRFDDEMNEIISAGIAQADASAARSTDLPRVRRDVAPSKRRTYRWPRS